MTQLGDDQPAGQRPAQLLAPPSDGPRLDEPRQNVLQHQPLASDVIRTPFGLVRMWEDHGRTYLAETSADGAVLGAPVALAGGSVRAWSAAAAVHRLDDAFLLTVAWLSGSDPGRPGDVLLQTWHLGRGPLGLQLTAANDNPIVIGASAAEVAVTSLPGEELLLTWVEQGTGNVCSQIRNPTQDGATAPAYMLGQTVVEWASGSRRVQAIETAPLQFAVFWLAASGHEIRGVSWDRVIGNAGEDAAVWTAHSLQSVQLERPVLGGLAMAIDHSANTLQISYQTSAGDGGVAEFLQVATLAPAGHAPGVLAGPHGTSLPDDFGFQWAAHDLLQLAPSALFVPGAARHQGPLVTQADEPLLIDLAAHGAPPGLKVTTVGGTPFANEGPTRIDGGWLQMRPDGHLTFTPDVDTLGHVRLALGGLHAGGAPWHRHLDVLVEGLYEASEVVLRNPVKAIPAQAVIAHNAQVAEIGFRGDAPPHGAVSLAGADAAKFVVIGNGLFLRGGTQLEPGRKALDVAVHYKDGLAGAAIAASLTIAVLADPSGFLSLAMPARAHAAPLHEGMPVAEIGVLDQSLGGDRISLALLSSAGGRFALSGGNLVIASPHLFTHDPETTYDVVVRMAQPNGVAIDQKITLHHEDVLGRAPISAEKMPVPPMPDEKPAEPVVALPELVVPAAVAATPQTGDEADAPVAPEVRDDDNPDVLPPLHVDAHAPTQKGSSVQPELIASKITGRGGESDNLSKLVAQQRDGGDADGEAHSRDMRATQTQIREDRGSSHEKDLIAALRNVQDGEGHRSSNAGSGSDELQKAQQAVSGDTLLFKPGFGKETIEHVKVSGGEAHDTLDLSLYGTTFEALRAAGAFEQVGNDVVLTLSTTDAAHPDQIVLKSTELHHIDPGDFKFS